MHVDGMALFLSLEKQRCSLEASREDLASFLGLCFATLPLPCEHKLKNKNRGGLGTKLEKTYVHAEPLIGILD